MKLAIQVHGLAKRYGSRRALDGLDLDVPSGSSFGLVGPNGAGKTTTMLILCGLLRAGGGRIDLLGGGPFQAAVHKGRVTLLPQDSRFPSQARVRELLEYYARLQGLSRAEAACSAREALAWVDLVERAESPIRTLSHGMIRRVSVAQAFLGDPELVILDEPTSGLDPRQVVQIRELILSRRGRQTILLSSHNLPEIEAACDHVAFIEAGRTVRQDTMEEVTGRSRMIVYGLEGPVPPLDGLRASLAAAAFELSSDGRSLTVRYGGDGLSASRVNQIVLGCLLQAGCGILEVRLGSNLEREYLRSRPGPGEAGAA